MRAALRSLLAAAALAAVPAACASRAASPVDGDRMLARVAHQVDQGPRVPGTPAHEAVRAWMVEELTRLGARVEQQAFADTSLGRPLALTNVIARYGPAGGRPLLLCAHWDTRPFADQDPDSTRRGTTIPGANDGGSGVAVLLEMAELLHRRASPSPVELVFLDGEDLGRADRPDEFSIGARHYAATLAARAPEDRPRAGFLFDMVGDRDLEIHPEVQSAERAANLVALVQRGAEATGAAAFKPDPRYALTDDHIPLLEAGIPTVDIIDFDYPAWHTRRDSTDQVSAESLAQVGRVAAWLVFESPLARAR